ncbi:heme-degrading domain-containing protein [Brachybacterium kimchii]|uniref:Heme-binding protein n=1 Tax=Brachybacterium kimchii TaxID=2942909 RepID=A0ABY4N2H8_9MICO|nr:heme-binding protein [Brachybacterium kimchii]UQN28770.1 heme-binding protein [Brachybacterium kimchii]
MAPGSASLDIQALETEERELVLPRFSPEDAWALGVLTQSIAAEAGHGVVLDIRRPNLLLFRAVLPGATPDQQAWADRKAAVTLRLESSSALVDARLSAAGVDPASIGWLDEHYAVTGGSFPIRVRDVGVVAAITASGLSSQEDHDLVVSGLRAHLNTNVETHPGQ